MNRERPSLTRREVITTAAGVSLAGAASGCSNPEDKADVEIEDVWMEITDLSRLVVGLRLSNHGDGVGTPMGVVKVERDGDLIGKKKEQINIAPATESSVLKGTFSPLEKNVPRSEYTASGKISNHDWVTADDS